MPRRALCSKIFPMASSDPLTTARRHGQKPWPRRFYRAVSITTNPVPDGAITYGLALDGKAVKTAQHNALRVPVHALAAAMAREWQAQDTHILLSVMPLTRLAMAAQDCPPTALERIKSAITAYGGHDLICYYAAHPENLKRRQEAQWHKLHAFATARYDAPLLTTTTLASLTQPADSLKRLGAPVAALTSPLMVVAMQTLAQLSGSLVIPLAVLDEAITADEAFACAHVEEEFSRATWGDDEEANARLQIRRRDFEAAAHTLALAKTHP